LICFTSYVHNSARFPARKYSTCTCMYSTPVSHRWLYLPSSCSDSAISQSTSCWPHFSVKILSVTHVLQVVLI
jgi:hypothetical protein